MEQTNIDALFATPDRRMGNIRKWLRILLAVRIATLSFSFLASLINLGKLYNWIQAGLDIAVMFCLLQLRKENRLYKLAAGLMAADLVICLPDYVTFFRSILPDGYLELVFPMAQAFYYLGLVCGLGAVVAQYLAHRRLVKPYSPQMGKYWLYLLIANLAVSVLISGLGSVFASWIESGALSVITYQKYIFPLLRLPDRAVSLLYMLCLYKTERALHKT